MMSSQFFVLIMYANVSVYPLRNFFLKIYRNRIGSFVKFWGHWKVFFTQKKTTGSCLFTRVLASVFPSHVVVHVQSSLIFKIIQFSFPTSQH